MATAKGIRHIPDETKIGQLAAELRALANEVDAAIQSSQQPAIRGILPANTDLNILVSPSQHHGTYALGASSMTTYKNLPPDPDMTAGQLEVLSVGTGATVHRVTVHARNRTWQRVRVGYAPVTFSAWDLAVDPTLKPWNRGILPDGRDLNGLLQPDAGIWGISGSRSYLNTPEAGPATIEVIGAGTGAISQRVLMHASMNRYYRSVVATDGSRWNDWEKTSGGTGSAAPAENDTDPTAPAESLPGHIVMWGDSLTQAGGIAGRLGELLPGVTVTNRGISGQTAQQIAARQGGEHARLTVAGGRIPGSGPVEVTGRTVSLLAQTNYPALTEPGRLAGVPGTLSNAAGSSAYTFTRTTAGDPVNCPPGSVFITDAGKAGRHATTIFWAGRNNPETGVSQYVLAMARHLSPATKRFLVLSVTNAPTEPAGSDKYKLIERENLQLAYDFGNRFIDVRRWLIDNGLRVLGIAPTPQDVTAVNADAVPPSLTTDGIHFTPATQRAIADYLKTRLSALGWY